MRFELKVCLVAAFVSGSVHASCEGGGKTCVDSIYSSEKDRAFERTQSGAKLSSALPNSSSIEKNVDLSHLVTKSEHANLSNYVIYNDDEIRKRLGALESKPPVDNSAELEALRKRMSALESNMPCPAGTRTSYTVTYPGYNQTLMIPKPSCAWSKVYFAFTDRTWPKIHFDRDYAWFNNGWRWWVARTSNETNERICNIVAHTCGTWMFGYIRYNPSTGAFKIQGGYQYGNVKPMTMWITYEL
ncbi:hypothetical protein [Vibrio barjaei]|uniref:hypothetical protein n=1 Tax=Vibrio barjaei TaxID=1676683 RepID=UPI002283BB88|nr:hypothetical protein [Vibrio barjaei]MCY9874054.1 hypothetical protein [Vibrio barjaei]